MENSDMLNEKIKKLLLDGCVIPAHPLALTKDNKIDETHQRALTRYYLSAGADGLAVGVHTTQFMIHKPKVGLYKPVLELAQDTASQWQDKILIAGILGETEQALNEAKIAKDMGYHLGLLSLTALKNQPVDKLIEHARAVAEIIPVMGFYLQSTISGMKLPIEFWRRFIEIPNVQAVKISPFNRYQTLDVLKAVAESGRDEDIALYTGNDDTIIIDLLTDFEFNVNGKIKTLRITGGLLGQWACWTAKAVEMFNQIKHIKNAGQTTIPSDMLTLASQLTLANSAIFNPENDFAGCIPGIMYVLQRVGLVEEIRTLDPNEKLADGQAERIDEIIEKYPHLNDEEFVAENIDKWLK